MRLRQLARDPPVEGGIVALVLGLEREGGQLERIKNVAEVQFRERADRVGVFLHAAQRMPRVPAVVPTAGVSAVVPSLPLLSAAVT